MSIYLSWETDTVEVTELLLDAENPRLPDLGHEATPREIVAELIKHEALYDLAKDIANQGYFPTETLVCIQEGGSLVVVEGNRRLASLKLLLSPELAPQDLVAKFRALSRKATETGISTKVNVVIASSRADAAPLIMNRHTQIGIKRWEPIQQAKYINSLRATGLSITQISVTTGFPRGELVHNLRTHGMYEIANRLNLDDKTAASVSDARRFNISTLERVIGSTKLRKFLGIAFDNEGGVTGSVHPDDFRKAYKRIITDIASGEIDTRKLNNDERISEYIQKIDSVRPKRAGTFDTHTLLGKADASSKAATTGRPKAKRDRASAYLVPRTIKCHLKMARIGEILEELQHLKISGFENAVAVLLRIFVEMSISHYMESIGSMAALVSRLDKRGEKPNDWTPSFRQMLGDLLRNDHAVIAAIPKQALKALNKAVSDDDHPLSLDGMDQFVHNPYVAPTERQLRQFWNAFESLIIFLMDDHRPPKPTGNSK